MKPETLHQGWGTCGPCAKCGPRVHMARIRIFLTQVKSQHRVKTKLHDKQTLSLLYIVLFP